MPLNPSVAATITEIPARGTIAMALNGVPAYGPMEGNDFNAVEGANAAGGAAFWYGHASNAVWHFHSK